jgi:hypothetical protein
VRASVHFSELVTVRVRSVSGQSINQINQSINQSSGVPCSGRPPTLAPLCSADSTRLPQEATIEGPPVVRRLRAHRSPIAANRTPLELSNVSVTANHHGPPLQHLDSRSM